MRNRYFVKRSDFSNFWLVWDRELNAQVLDAASTREEARRLARLYNRPGAMVAPSSIEKTANS